MQTNEKDKEKNFPKVLLLGNGINICNGCERWSDFLLSIRDKKFDMDVKTLKSPMPLQAVLISNNTIDEKLKEKSKKLLPSQKLVCDNFPVNKILSLGFENILTTKYTYELEQASFDNQPLSADKLKKLFTHSENYKADRKYTIHSYNKVIYEGKEEKIWHIHGEARKHSSMVLGHYYYGKLVKKIIEYVDGRSGLYWQQQEEGKEIKTDSWIDAFIMGDVYVLGFTFDFSEVDLWWLLNRKFNEKAEHGKVYFYEPIIETEKEKVNLLEVFGVKVMNMGIEEKIIDGKSYIDYKTFYEKAYYSMKNGLSEVDIAI